MFAISCETDQETLASEIQKGGTGLRVGATCMPINPAQLSGRNPYDRSEGTFASAENSGLELVNDFIGYIIRVNFRSHVT